MSLKKTVARLVGDALDVHIIPRAQHGWPEERFATALWRTLGIDCIFDVGANVGQYGREVRRLGYTGTILSFEPGPAAFASLSAAAAADPRWHVFNHALGEQAGALPFNIMASTAMSSFFQPATKAGDPFSDVNVVERTIDVPVHTLAETYPELAARHGFRRPFLKLDTQGYDLHVIRGAGPTLRHMCAILSEVSVRRLYHGAPTIHDSLGTFEASGFDLVGLFSVHPGNITDPHEFNCYVLRRDLGGVSP